MGRVSSELNAVDVEIGIKLQELRLAKGMSRQALASEVGVTHQQIQKYETGNNRIAASRLASIASFMQVPVNYFYEDVPGTEITLPTQHKRMSMEVARNFMKIKNPLHQDAINVLVRILAEN